MIPLDDNERRYKNAEFAYMAWYDHIGKAPLVSFANMYKPEQFWNIGLYQTLLEHYAIVPLDTKARERLRQCKYD